MTIGHMPSPRTGFSSIKNGRVVRYIFYDKTSDVEKAAKVLESRGLRVADQGPNFVSYYGTPSKREERMLARHEDVTQYNPHYRQIATASFRRKFESCVMQVKRSGSPVNPWAVCTTTLKGYPKRNPGGPTIYLVVFQGLASKVFRNRAFRSERLAKEAADRARNKRWNLFSTGASRVQVIPMVLE